MDIHHFCPTFARGPRRIWGEDDYVVDDMDLIFYSCCMGESSILAL